MKLDRAAHIAALGILYILVAVSSAAAFSTAVEHPRPVGIVHQYPLAGAREVPTSTDIGIRAIGAYDLTFLQKQTFVALGSISGVHPLVAHLSHDRTMAIFHAATPYANGEDVRFAMSAMLIGGTTVADTFHFTTMIHPAPTSIPDWVRNEVPQHASTKRTTHTMNVEDDSLPAMSVTVDDSATPGTIYFNNYGVSEPVPNDDCILNCDEHGKLTRYQVIPNGYGVDFKVQLNEEITYYDVNTGNYLGLDSAWNVIDTFAALHYPTDEHELRVEPDGSYLLLGITTTIMDLSSISGYDSAEVFGAVIQKFDVDKNLIFEWRGIDHYNVIDSKYEDLTTYAIDFQHANSLDLDADGNILISNRHLCEISNIDGVTGDFIWRLGGAHNQFKLVGDSMWFSFQHDARWLPNGNMTIFDNSNYDTVTGGNGQWIQKSRACEYAIDTLAKTVALVWQYHHTPETWGDAMGSVQRLQSGNTLIGWGNDTSVAMTEIRPDNSTAFEMVMGNGNVSYRAYKDENSGITGKGTSGSLVASAPPNTGNTFAIQAGADGTVSAAFSLGRSQPVTLTVYDMAGRAAEQVLGSEFEAAGDHAIPLGLSGMPNGAYECVLTTENGTMVRSFCHF
jgi:hypothetical protein